MNIKEFERMLCDSLNDTIDKKMPEELFDHLHFVDTLARLKISEVDYGMKVILNDGSIFYLNIFGHKTVDIQ